jgi:GDP-L-fucose synthase
MAKQKIFVTGHNGMVGSAIVRQLERKTDIELFTAARTELNLLDQAAVQTWFENNPVDQVYIGAAKGGGYSCQQ